MTAKRPMSAHAAAAKAMRQELRKAIPGVKFSVRSSSFFKGTVVNVYWDGEGTTEREISKVISKYQIGIGDADSGIPQVNYVQLHVIRD